MSMACSIESRVPFLDHVFVEFAASVPPHMKQRGKEGKHILKKAVGDLLPESIIYRQKQGFPTPIRDWLLRDRAKVLVDYLRDPEGILAAYINQEFLHDLLEKHYSGKYDATDRIWRLLNLQVWGDMYLTGRREQFWDGLTAGSRPRRSNRMRILWVKCDFLHPTTRGGQIRTLEIVKRLHARHEVHYLAYDSDNPEGLKRSAEYCTRAYPVRLEVPPRRSLAFAAQLAANLFSSMPLSLSRYCSAAMRSKSSPSCRKRSSTAWSATFFLPRRTSPAWGNACCSSTT